jgi:hypothetical protein
VALAAAVGERFTASLMRQLREFREAMAEAGATCGVKRL